MKISKSNNPKSDSNLQKIKVINGFGLIGSIAFAYFAGRNLMFSDFHLGIIELVLAILVLAELLFLKITKKHNLVSTLLLVQMIFLMIVLIIRGGILNSGVYWIMIIPIFAFFTKGSKKGLYYFLALIVIFTFFIFGRELDFISIPYDANYLIQVLINLLVVSFLVYYYSVINEDLLNNLNSSKKQLMNALDDLDKYKLAVDHSQDAVLITDKNSVVLYANDALEKITGFTKQEIVGKKAGSKELWGGEMDKEFYENLWHTVSINKMPFRAEIINKNKKGEKYYVDMQIVPLLDENNEVNFFVQIQHDITSRKLREIEVRRFQLAVENVSDQIVITDPEGVVLYANPIIEKVTGFKRQEIIGKKAGSKELWGGNMDKEFYKNMWDVIKNKKQTFTGELINKRKNGVIYTARTSVTPVLSEDTHEILFFVGVERDITFEKEVDNMKTHFISLASHQLRTPLSAMRWFSEILMEGDAGKLNDKQKEIVNNIYESNKRMIDLVNSLLNISRIESGRVIVSPEPTNICDFTNEIIVDLKTKLKEKDQKIEVKCEKNLPTVNLDKSLVRNVFMNLFTNAMKYSNKKQIIKTEILKNKDFIQVKVIDHGIGINMQDQEKVFEKFYRGANAIKSETEGSGLGLYLAKIIVESSGGKIWFESSKQKGTIFYFELPISGMKKKKGEVKIDS